MLDWSIPHLPIIMLQQTPAHLASKTEVKLISPKYALLTISKRFHGSFFFFFLSSGPHDSHRRSQTRYTPKRGGSSPSSQKCLGARWRQPTRTKHRVVNDTLRYLVPTEGDRTRNYVRKQTHTEPGEHRSESKKRPPLSQVGLELPTGRRQRRPKGLELQSEEVERADHLHRGKAMEE